HTMSISLSPLYALSRLFSFSAPPSTAIYTLSLHDALPICTDEVTGASETSESDADASPEDIGSSESRDAGSPADGEEEAEPVARSEEHTSELQSRENLVCRLLLEKKKT